MDYSNINYTDRATKAKFVFSKYQEILTGKILDVGADEMYLKKYLTNDVEYIGVGLGKNKHLIKMNLENEPIPYSENYFDCILCLDVLEHLDNIHNTFETLCKLTNKWLLISLPNPYNSIFEYLNKKKYRSEMNIKFYGLPVQKPEDRHKWFFSSFEAKEFIKSNAKKMNMNIQDVFIEKTNFNKYRLLNTNSKIINWIFNKIAYKHFFNPNLELTEFLEGTQWYLLKKQS